MLEPKVNKLVKLAEKFLIGYGPSITIISANHSGDDLKTSESSNSKLEDFIMKTFELESVLKRLDSSHDLKYPIPSLVVFGMKPTQASFVASRFKIPFFWQKDEDGFWSKFSMKIQHPDEQVVSDYYQKSEPMIANGFKYCYPCEYKSNYIAFDLNFSEDQKYNSSNE